MGKITKTLAILVFVGLAVTAAAACAASPRGTSSPGGRPSPSPAASHRHSSGLLIVTDDDLIQEAAPDGLGDALGAYDMLSYSFPDDLGYANVIKGEVVIDVATEAGAAIVESFVAGEAMHPDHDTEGKMAGSLAELRKKIGNFQVTTRRVAYTRRACEKVSDEAIELSAEFKSARIFQSGVHRPTGQVVLRMEELTDAVAAAIVNRYGTEKIVVVLEPAPEMNLN